MPSTVRRLFRTGSTSQIGKICFGGALSLSAPAPATGMRVLDSYGMVYLESGRGTYTDTLGTCSALVAGDVVLLFPDVGHRYGPMRGHAWEEMFIVFEGPVFDLWRTMDILTPTHPVIRLGPNSDWCNRMSALLDGGTVRNPSEALSEVCRLQTLLADALDRVAQTRTSTDDEEWCNLARSRLTAHTRQQASLTQIAKELGMSYDGFRKRFKRQTGQSPARFRAEVAIDEACRLILDGRLTLAQIAGELGYWDEAHLSRRFSQVMGMSPRQFRRTMHSAGSGNTAATDQSLPSGGPRPVSE